MWSGNWSLTIEETIDEYVQNKFGFDLSLISSIPNGRRWIYYYQGIPFLEASSNGMEILISDLLTFSTGSAIVKYNEKKENRMSGRLLLHKGRHLVVAPSLSEDATLDGLTEVQVEWVALSPTLAGSARRGKRPSYTKPVPVSDLVLADATMLPTKN